ncbi:MAG: hypothetical protein JNK65_07690 [Deltaproteobacteria bacterium]|nr:hypothetical protein [Deltaproteobacteria bacterium]
MTTPTYHFNAVDRSDLALGNSDDLFRFYRESQPVPTQSGNIQSRFHLEARDLNGDRRLDQRDAYLYHATDGAHPVSPELGLNLLNYFNDPNILRQRNQGMVVLNTNQSSSNTLAPADLSSILEIPTSERDLFARHRSYWELDGHLDLDILEGVRLYAQAENEPWTRVWGPGTFRYFDGRYFASRVLGEKGAIAGIFMTGEHFINPTFMWQMYTTNFLSMVTGSFLNNARSESTIHNAELLANDTEIGNSTRRMANNRTAENRIRIAQDHLYFTVTWPVVIAACFGDPQFRKFWAAPWRLPNFGMIGNYFDTQFRTAIPAIGRTRGAWAANPLGLGLLAASGFGIYEVASAWFDIYGGLRQGTTENRTFAGGSTVLIEAALLNRASREMRALTGSGELSFHNFSNLSRVIRANEVGLNFEIAEGSLLGRYYSSSARLQQVMNTSRFLPTVEVAARERAFNPLGRLFDWVGLPHPSLEVRAPLIRRSLGSASLEALSAAPLVEGAEASVLAQGAASRIAAEEVAAGETLTARAAIIEAGGVEATAGESLIARMAAFEEVNAVAAFARQRELVMGEEFLAAGRTRLVGIPLLGAAALVGLGIGAGYMSGYFNQHYTPMHMMRSWLR